MSLEAPDEQLFIERIAQTLEASLKLFPLETTGENLVNTVVRNAPAIIQSPDETMIPYITVFSSDRPIKFLEKAGRDARNVEGGGVYEMEFYCVAVTNVEISREAAQQNMNIITQAIRDALSRNLRLSDPPTGIDPLCRTTERYQVPYLLRGDIPTTMRAMNVVVRPQVYVSPRSP